MAHRTVSQTHEENADDFEHIEFTYKWDSSAKEQFIQTLNSNAVQDRLYDITEGLNFVGNESDIDSNLNCFYRIIDDVCSPSFKKKKNSNLSNNVTQTQSKKHRWFDSECEDQQNMFYSSLHDYRREKSELNRQSMVENRNAYKQLLRKKRYQYDKNQT